MKKNKLSSEELDIIISILGDEIEKAKWIGRDSIKLIFLNVNKKNDNDVEYSLEKIKKLRNRVRKVFRDTLLERD